MQSVVIIGNSITAEVVYDLIKKDERYKVECFSVDKQYINQKRFHDLETIEIDRLTNVFDKSNIKIIVATGYSNLNKNRELIFQRIIKYGFQIETYIHPDAKVHSKNIGNGCLIFPGAIVDPFCKIGNNVVIWSNAICAHHSVVGNNCWIASGSILSGEVKIGHNTFLGVGSTIVNKVEVGSYNIIGAGATITKCTNAYEVYLTKSGEKIPFNSKEYSKAYGY